MLMTAWWFVVNMIFVVFFIMYLFAHRAYVDARTAGDAELIRRRKGRRTLLGLLAVVSFAGMAALFTANMYYNG